MQGCRYPTASQLLAPRSALLRDLLHTVLDWRATAANPLPHGPPSATCEGLAGFWQLCLGGWQLGRHARAPAAPWSRWLARQCLHCVHAGSQPWVEYLDYMAHLYMSTNYSADSAPLPAHTV